MCVCMFVYVCVFINGWLLSSIGHGLFAVLSFALLASVHCDSISWMVILMIELSQAYQISSKFFTERRK